MRLLFSGSTSRYAPGKDTGEAPEPRRETIPIDFGDEVSARGLFSEVLRDPLQMINLRILLSREGLAGDISRLPDQDLITEVSRKVTAGYIRVAGPNINTRSIGSGSSQADRQRGGEDTRERTSRRAQAFPQPGSGEEPGHWIGLRVVDDETGEPISGVSLKIRLSSGKTRKPSTDDQGSIELQDIPPGTVDIEMPDREGWEVVGIG